MKFCDCDTLPFPRRLLKYSLIRIHRDEKEDEYDDEDEGGFNFVLDREEDEPSEKDDEKKNGDRDDIHEL
jgi:hypothetical protein